MTDPTALPPWSAPWRNICLFLHFEWGTRVSFLTQLRDNPRLHPNSAHQSRPEPHRTQALDAAIAEARSQRDNWAAMARLSGVTISRFAANPGEADTGGAEPGGAPISHVLG